MSEFNVPHTAYPYLAQQRTDYAGHDLGAHYEQDMQRLFYNIEPCLPLKLTSVLDIGAGLGGIDVMIYRAHPNAVFTLMDKDGDYGSKVGWHDEVGDFGVYNSFEETGKFMQANNMPSGSVILTSTIPEQTFDIVFSFLSWGFHYPVDTYLEEVRRKTTSLIIDVRKETGGLDVLEQAWPTVEIIADCKKHHRVWCRA